MKLPYAALAIVDERKVRDYLLSPSHRIGRFKAKFFESLGFGPDNWWLLATAIVASADHGEVRRVETTAYGRKYLALGPLVGPNGRSAMVASVWIVRPGDDRPWLVTVYPRWP